MSSMESKFVWLDLHEALFKQKNMEFTQHAKKYNHSPAPICPSHELSG